MHVVARDEGRAVVLTGLGADIRFDGEAVSASSDAALCLALLPAMRARERLRILGPVSRRLRSSTDELQDIFTLWDPALDRIDVETEEGAQPEGDQRRGSALFFSGGVDSLYALKKHESDIDALVTVIGFDVDERDDALSERVITSLERAATSAGKRLLAIRTDLRRSPPVRAVHWGTYHGAALAGVAHLLPFRTMYIASTYSYDALYPWGSHPLTDPKWSSETMELVHTGSEARRLEKIRALSEDPRARRTLRVCWRNPNGAYNCGSCEKCVRTMVSLEALGVLREFETFPSDLTARVVRRAVPTSPWKVRNARANLALLRERGARPDLVRAVRGQLRRARWRSRYPRASHLARRAARKIRAQVTRPPRH